MIEDSADTAKGQLLRADHLFHVTLKYTRTTDVIANIIKRLIEALELGMREFLKKKKAKQIPKNPHVLVQKIEEGYKNNKKVQEIIRFYKQLVRINKAEHHGKEEYRKNVTLIAGKANINQDKVEEFYNKTREYIKNLEEA